MIAIATAFIVIVWLIVLCHRTASEEDKVGRGFFSILGHKRHSSEHEMEDGDFWRRWLLWLWDMYWPVNTMHKKNVKQKLHDNYMSDGDEGSDKMEKGEASMSTAKVTTSDLAVKKVKPDPTTME